MNFLHLNRMHEEAFKVFDAVPGSDIEFEYHCRCGMVSEATFTVPHPRMGSIKILARCPQCHVPGQLVLSPVEESR